MTACSWLFRASQRQKRRATRADALLPPGSCQPSSCSGVVPEGKPTNRGRSRRRGPDHRCRRCQSSPMPDVPAPRRVEATRSAISAWADLTYKRRALQVRTGVCHVASSKANSRTVAGFIHGHVWPLQECRPRRTRHWPLLESRRCVRRVLSVVASSRAYRPSRLRFPRKENSPAPTFGWPAFRHCYLEFRDVLSARRGNRSVPS